MTVPQQRLVVKEPADRWGSQRVEEWAGATHKPKCRAMRNASGALLPALALSGEELWQQEGRMPRRLKEGMLLLTPTPGPLSRKKQSRCAHWTEHVASLQHSRGALQRLQPWRQGAVTEGEEKVSRQRQEPSLPLQKRWLSLLYNQKRQ